MKHLPISRWLSQLGLPQYCRLFDEEYDGVEVRPTLSTVTQTETTVGPYCRNITPTQHQKYQPKTASEIASQSLQGVLETSLQ